jgi:hypothetical protein
MEGAQLSGAIWSSIDPNTDERPSHGTIGIHPWLLGCKSLRHLDHKHTADISSSMVSNMSQVARAGMTRLTRDSQRVQRLLPIVSC